MRGCVFWALALLTTRAAGEPNRAVRPGPRRPIVWTPPPLPLATTEIALVVDLVNVRMQGDQALVTEEIRIEGLPPRAVPAFLSYGSPGMPLALEVAQPDESGAWAALPLTRLAVASPAHLVVAGDTHRAGVAFVLPHRDRATKIRVRSVYAFAAKGESELIIRLPSGSPLAPIIRIEVAGAKEGFAERAYSANFCGAQSDERGLFVNTDTAKRSVGPLDGIAPSLALRHPSDALCVRLPR